MLVYFYGEFRVRVVVVLACMTAGNCAVVMTSCVIVVQVSVVENEACLLLDNAEENNLKWRVRNSSGVEGFLPAIIFLIPPPDRDIVQQARRCVFMQYAP